MIVNILLVLGGIIVLLLLIALFMKRTHYVNRAITINAPRREVFDYIKLLKNQDEFNKHAMTSPDRKREFKGTDGTVGYIYSWSGNNNGKQVAKGMDISWSTLKNILEK